MLGLAATAVFAGSASAYTVQSGDTLTGISQRTGEPVARIVAANHLADANRIHPGQQLLLDSPPAAAATPTTYTVRTGDSLWAIARRTRVAVADLKRLNALIDARRLQPGQQLRLAALPPAPASPPVPAPSAASNAVRGEPARLLVRAAALEFHVDPALAEALSLWESGWNQGVTSATGAVGLMQIEPYTAAWAGPALLHGRVDLADARQNARLGVALLGSYVAQFNDPRLALAAYYQGALGTAKRGIYPSSLGYVNGIMALASRLRGAARPRSGPGRSGTPRAAPPGRTR
ncbi:MAG: LysM peptidoglycan-binding domain-containing protein [Candidatus Dormibacteraeota bacterium]|nr:LysM peptidoglycan-binding domain-containing protein [Candidatus Dormibacteraeota bacterium]